MRKYSKGGGDDEKKLHDALGRLAMTLPDDITGVTAIIHGGKGHNIRLASIRS